MNLLRVLLAHASKNTRNEAELPSVKTPLILCNKIIFNRWFVLKFILSLTVSSQLTSLYFLGFLEHFFPLEISIMSYYQSLPTI